MSVQPTPAPFAGVYGTTVADVQALVPEATIYATREDIPVGNRAVTVDQVEQWITELSARVALTIDGWEHLTDNLPTPPPDADTVAITVHGAPYLIDVTSPTDLLTLASFARTVVANGAASYLEAARFPERAAKTSTSYADVLWTRFEDGLASLTAWWEKHRPKAATIEEDAASGTVLLPSGVFPAPVFTDTIGW